MDTATTLVTRVPVTPRKPGFFKNLLYWLLDIDDPAFIDAGVERMRNAPGYFESLTEEQLELLRSYDGPENLGPPLTKRERRDLERRIAAQQG